MNNHRSTTSKHDNRRGAMLPLVAICLPVILIFAAYSINVAQMQLARTELRTATDAACRAGARTLSITQNRDQAEDFAIEAASRNGVSNAPLLLRPSDVQFGLAQGLAEDSRWDFIEATNHGDPINSVRVTGSRTEGSLSGSIPMIFPMLSNRGVFQPRKVATATQIDRDIALVLDRSGSMTKSVINGVTIGSWRRNQPVPAGSRWLDLVAATDAFLAALENTPQDELVSLVTYAKTATHELDLSLNYNQIRANMDAHSQKFHGGRTAVGDGTDLGLQAVIHPNFARPYAEKTIVVMTDGNHNEGQWPDIVARMAQENHNVTVHTITFGPSVNATLMQQTADVGGGQYWHADSAATLIAVFQEIANNLPTLITE